MECVIETPEPYSGFISTEIMNYVNRFYGLDSGEIEIHSRNILEMMRI